MGEMRRLWWGVATTAVVCALVVPAGGAPGAAAGDRGDRVTVARVLEGQRELSASAAGDRGGRVTVARVLERQRALSAAVGVVGLPPAAESITGGATGFGSTVAAGAEHTCVTVTFTNVWCWGGNADGQLGVGTHTASRVPVRVSARGRPWNKFVLGITAGRAHTCATVLEEESVSAYCWGANERGQLGDGSLDTQTQPKEVATGVIGIAAGAEHTCVLSVELTVSCWGRNDEGQLGVDTSGADSASPQEIPGLADIVDVAAGGDSTCAVDADGRAWCWGAIASSAVPEPVSTTGISGGFGQISVGRAHACAIAGSPRAGGAAYCWGEDGAGQLGDGSGTVDSATPVKTGGNRAYVTVSAGGDSSCAVTVAGRGYCWGDNTEGQLGTGDTVGHTAPVAVEQQEIKIPQVVRHLYGAHESMIVEMTVGADRSCAVSAAMTLYCTSDGVLTAERLAPGLVRDVTVKPRDGALGVGWSPPIQEGIAPITGYAAVAVTSDLSTSSECGSKRMGCTVENLRNDRRYSVFVVAISDGGLSYSALTHGTPGAGGGGGGLPITGPGGTLVAAFVMLCAGLACTLITGRAVR